jgi:hypothetical protein
MLDDNDEKIKAAVGGRKVPVVLVDPTTEISVLALNGLSARSWKKRVATDTEFTTFDKSFLGSAMGLPSRKSIMRSMRLVSHGWRGRVAARISSWEHY